MIARRQAGERATLLEFAFYFVNRIGEIDDSDERQAAAQALGDILARNLDIRTVTVLGAGAFGAAAAHRNHVLKLTADQTEPPAAYALIGKKLRHVVRIYESAVVPDFRMVRIQGYRELPVGVILSERLDSVGLQDGQERVLDGIVSGAKHDFGVFDLDWDALEEAGAAICDASMALEERLFAEEGSLREIALGLEELRSHEVCLVDVHSRNVGYDRAAGVHKIFDLGLASSPADAVPSMRGR